MGEVVDLALRVDSKQVVAGAKNLDKLGKAGTKTAGHMHKLDTSIKGLAASVRTGTAMFIQMQASMLAITAIIATIAAISKAVTVTTDFSHAMSNLSAITGATGKDLKFMADAAKELGATTSLTASQAVVAFKLIASAKPDLLENAEALKQVTKEAVTLAEAASITIPQAAKVLGISLNQFGAGADEAAKFINILAAGAKFGSSEITETARALKKAGIVAKSAGLDFEQLNAFIQILAKNGLTAELAGTQLKTVLLRLTTVAADRFNPAIVGVVQAFKNLSEANLTSTEETKLFGLEAITAGKILADNAGIMDAFTAKLTGTSIAAEQARINLDDLTGDWLRFKSVLAAVTQNIGEELEPAARTLLQTLTDMLKTTNKLIDNLTTLGKINPHAPKKGSNFLDARSDFAAALTPRDNNQEVKDQFQALFDAEQDAASAALELKKELFIEEITASKEKDLAILESQLDAIEEAKAANLVRIAEEEKADAKRVAAKKKAEDTIVSMKMQTEQQLVGLIRAAAGNDKGALLAALALEKAFAVARIQISTEVAAAKATEAGPAGIILAAQIRALGAASTALVIGMGIAEAVSISGQAHDGLSSVPNTGTFILEKGERVVKKEDNKALTRALANGNLSGGTTMIINVDATGSANVEEVVRQAAEQGAMMGYERVGNDLRRGGPLRTVVNG